MIFITDLDCATKASTSKKITTIGLGLQNDMILQCCRTFQIEGNSHSDIIRTLGNVHAMLEASRDQGHLVVYEVHVSKWWHSEAQRKFFQELHSRLHRGGGPDRKPFE